MNTYARPATLAILFSLVLTGLIACGGDDDDGAVIPPGLSGDDDDNGDSNGDGGGEGNGSNGDTVATDLEEGTARITVGGETYDFVLGGESPFRVNSQPDCHTVAGGILAFGYVTDGREITVDLEVPPVDWENSTTASWDPPYFSLVDRDAGARWIADEDFGASGTESLMGLEGLTQVGAYETDGNRATGVATFANYNLFNQDEDFAAVEGTFEIHCAD